MTIILLLIVRKFTEVGGIIHASELLSTVRTEKLTTFPLGEASFGTHGSDTASL